MQPDTEAPLTELFQWKAALLAGLVTGLILMVIPRGSPWASVSFFSETCLGRTFPPRLGIAPIGVWSLHLLLSLVYGLLIARAIARLHQHWAFLVGALVDLLLYALNLGFVHLFFPSLAGNEISVAFTHLAFGLIAAGTYRGLLRRRRVRVRNDA